MMYKVYKLVYLVYKGTITINAFHLYTAIFYSLENVQSTGNPFHCENNKLS